MDSKFLYTMQMRKLFDDSYVLNLSNKMLIFQVFVPNGVKLFGSAHLITRGITFCSSYSYIQNIYITKVHVKAIDQPSHRCTSETNRPKTTSCLANYIGREIGCSPNILGSLYPEGVLCNNKSQVDSLDKMTKIFQNADENEIYSMTGCLSSCEKYHYAISAAPLERKPQRMSDFCEVHAKFQIIDRSFEEKEQYVIYDTDSFFADIGGYMGLLLGSSFISLYNEIEAFLRSLLCGSRQGREVYIC